MSKRKNIPVGMQGMNVSRFLEEQKDALDIVKEIRETIESLKLSESEEFIYYSLMHAWQLNGSLEAYLVCHIMGDSKETKEVTETMMNVKKNHILRWCGKAEKQGFFHRAIANHRKDAVGGLLWDLAFARNWKSEIDNS